MSRRMSYGFGLESDHGLDDQRWVDLSRTNSKITHPYSYSEFYVFGGPAENRASEGADYSDRLWQWDYDRAQRLWKEHCDCRWAQAEADKLSAFMSAYHGRPLVVTALAEGCNPSNGYPYWIVWYRNALKGEAVSNG